MTSFVDSLLARWRNRAATPGAPAIAPALLKSLAPLLALAIGLTALVLMYFWSDQANYKPVFGAREKVAATDMMAALDADHIAYRLHPDSGQVLVPQAQLGRVRMLLAAKGVTAQLPAGLELMDRNDPLGVSQFVQDVRFRRGLEGELAQSIMTLDAIAGARVHLSIAKSTSFVSSDGEKSSASVVVSTKPGRTLSPEQIAAVINMVAGSVASLAPARVSLVDQSGALLSARIDLADGYDANGNTGDSVKRIEDEVRRNARELLGPSLGEDNFKLSVTAAVDNDRVEQTVEKYGDAPKVTSEAMREEQDRNRMAIGVPGTLSNRPPQTEPAKTADGKPADDGSQRKNATTRQYAYDRSVTHTKRSRGRIEKLSVAVVLNSAAAPAKTGWNPDQIANIDRILRNGLGIDAERGDKLAVSALPFPAKPVPLAWYAERDNIVDGAGYLVYGVGALLAFLFVLRPLMKLAKARLAPPLRLPDLNAPSLPVLAGAAATHGAPALAAAATSMPVVPLLENYELPPAGSAVDVMVDHLKVLAGKEPERVAEVVKQWMQKNARAL